MHSPPMLYSTDARKTHSVPVRLPLFSTRFSPIRQKAPCPVIGQRALQCNAVPPLVRPPLAGRTSRSSCKLPRGNGRNPACPLLGRSPAVQAAAPRGRFTGRPLPLSPAGGSLNRVRLARVPFLRSKGTVPQFSGVVKGLRPGFYGSGPRAAPITPVDSSSAHTVQTNRYQYDP